MHRFFSVSFKSVRLPVEVWMTLLFGIGWLIGVTFGLPINRPTAADTLLIQFHFIWPVTLAALAQMIFSLVVGILRRTKQHIDPFLMAKLFPFVIASVFFYFNFKSWMPLVNSRLYDPQLQALDELAAPVLTSFITTRQWIATALPFEVDSWYIQLYFAMFFLSMSIHGVLDTPQHQRHLVLGICLNLMLGGISYWILPAEGPFLYRQGVNEPAFGAQQAMHTMFQHVQATGQLPSGYFTASLGAMPSLHVAHALFFTLCAARSARVLLVPYIPVLFWIIIEAAASGWHYLADLPMGALLAVISFTLAARWTSATTSGVAQIDQQGSSETKLAQESLPAREKGFAG